MARTSGSCLIGQQKATTRGAGRAAIKCATMRADKTSCSASLSAARRATMSRRNARRQPVLSSFASCITVISMKFRTRFAPLLLALALPVFAQNGDSAFLNAREAFRAGKLDKLERPSASPAITNWRPTPKTTGCACGWKGRPVGDSRLPATPRRQLCCRKLRADWIRWLGKRAAWSEVDAEFPALLAPSPMSPASASRRAWRDDRSVNEADKLWQAMLEPPEPCRPVLDALVASQAKTADDVWARARRQVEINRPARPEPP